MLYIILPIVAVLVGVLLALFLWKKSTSASKLLLSFSGSFLLALTLFDLLPEVYQSLNTKMTGLYIMIGILLQIILEFFSKGAEHGHVHASKNIKSFPLVLFISICIHSFLEGFPLEEGNSIIYGVMVHKIPIAAVLTIFLLNSKCTRSEVILFMTLFALMTPLGTFISQSEILNSHYKSVINAVVIGIFFHISTTILFETGKGHSFNLSKLISILMGIGIAYFI